MTQTRSDGAITIVTPSFEKHYVQFSQMVESLCEFCEDLDKVRLVTIVEERNLEAFSKLLEGFPRLSSRILITEDALSHFGLRESPASFIKKAGKFTFQTLKKFYGLRLADTQWSLVLDSETIFHKPFSAMQMLDDYTARKYVFYTHTAPRGDLWQKSLGYQVTQNAADVLRMQGGDRWYMEYFHWFYETSKVEDLLENHLGLPFFNVLANSESPCKDFFENIIYYLYLEKMHSHEYNFVDFKDVLSRHLPADISARFKLNELPFALFGNEYLLNILSPSEVPLLADMFDFYKLPFVRLEPPYFSHRYIEELKRLPTFVATISSHHMTWLRKKIAVCISGEFRHVIHRTPEHQVRHLLGFLSGVDCDVYLHGWSNSSEALIVDVLRPRGYKFEPRPPFSALARRIKTAEPNIKPGRDEGSIAMFYGIQEAFKLMEVNSDEYDFVVRLRPDLYSELSLKELLVRISDEGDFLPEAIYFPRHFHSKGINDQLALGPVGKMRVYASTFSYISENIEKMFFNPESVLLRHLLERRVQIATLEAPYSLMREVPFKIGTIHERAVAQHHTWWSRTDDLPQFEDLTAFFTDKLHAMEAAMVQSVPDLVYLRAPTVTQKREESGGASVLRARVFDNDPSRPVMGLFKENGRWRSRPFVIDAGRVRQTAVPEPKHVFIYPQGAGVRLTEWRWDSGKFIRNTLEVGAADVSPSAGGIGVRMKDVLGSQAREERRHRSREVWARRRNKLRKLVGLRH